MSSPSPSPADSASDGSSANPALLADIRYEDYIDERQLPAIQQLVAGDLSEPYSVFTYRYFLLSWPNLCICVYDYAVSPRVLIGTIICKADNEFGSLKGYIAMLAVDKRYRKCGIGSKLVVEGMRRMVAMNCDEIHLETEVTNLGAISLYERLGFAKDERMARYYLNGSDAYRLKLWVQRPELAGEATHSQQLDAASAAVV